MKILNVYSPKIMRKKTFTTKLVLAKETIVNLDNQEMKNLKGGVTATNFTRCDHSCPNTMCQ